jgi:hypothetical protein
MATPFSAISSAALAEKADRAGDDSIWRIIRYIG